MALSLQILPNPYAVSRLPAGSPVPVWSDNPDFYAITSTNEELSVVCPESQTPEGVKSERQWRILKILGPLEFSLVGILAEISQVLAASGVSIYAISTFDTDYILLKQGQLEVGLDALRSAGYNIVERV
jgi:hypothetical protein